MPTKIMPVPVRHCVRCTILGKLDRAGYCLMCQVELADGRVSNNWEGLGTELDSLSRSVGSCGFVLRGSARIADSGRASRGARPERKR